MIKIIFRGADELAIFVAYCDHLRADPDRCIAELSENDLSRLRLASGVWTRKN